MNRSREVDTSPEAIAERLEALRALYRLGTARPLGRVDVPRREGSREAGDPERAPRDPTRPS